MKKDRIGAVALGEPQPIGLDGGAPFLDVISDKRSDKLYACVVDDNGMQRSMLWRFMANKNDIYAGGPGMHHQKLSLHASRQCRWANVAPQPDGADRAFIKWVRSPTTERSDIVFKIVFPEVYLAPAKPLERDTHLTLKLPMPPKGGAIELAIAFSTTPPSNMRVPPEMAKRYMAVGLTNREWVYFVPQRVDEYDHSQLNFPTQLDSRTATEHAMALTGPTAAFMHLYCGPNESGMAAVIEIGNLIYKPNLLNDRPTDTVPT